MSVELLDCATITSFVEDDMAFNSCVEHRFTTLDTNHDGVLSYPEILKELQSLRVFETHFGVDVKVGVEEINNTYGELFHQFDHDLNGAVDIQEFKAETKRMMIAVANGLGFLPVHMVLEQDSLLKKAVDRELANIAP